MHFSLARGHVYPSLQELQMSHSLSQADFLAQIAERAGQGMRLYFRTDDTDYFAAAATTVREHPAWEIIDEPWAFEFETVFQQRAQGFHSLVARPKP